MNDHDLRISDRLFFGSRIAKYIAMVLLAVFILVQFFGGGKVSSTDISTAAAAVTGAVDTSLVAESDNQMIRRLYGLTPTDYAGCVLYAPVSNMDAQEILIVRLNDTTQKESVRQAMEKRRDDQINTFEGYGPAQVGLLENSVIYAEGNYCLYIVGEDAALGAAAFKKAL